MHRGVKFERDEDGLINCKMNDVEFRELMAIIKCASKDRTDIARLSIGMEPTDKFYNFVFWQAITEFEGENEN